MHVLREWEEVLYLLMNNEHYTSSSTTKGVFQNTPLIKGCFCIYVHFNKLDERYWATRSVYLILPVIEPRGRSILFFPINAQIFWSIITVFYVLQLKSLHPHLAAAVSANKHITKWFLLRWSFTWNSTVLYLNNFILLLIQTTTLASGFGHNQPLTH